MIATVIRSFTDRRKNKRFRYGDIVDVPTSDFERYTANEHRPLMEKGRKVIKGGICHPCLKKKQLKKRKENG